MEHLEKYHETEAVPLIPSHTSPTFLSHTESGTMGILSFLSCLRSKTKVLPAVILQHLDQPPPSVVRPQPVSRVLVGARGERDTTLSSADRKDHLVTQLMCVLLLRSMHVLLC